MHGRGAEEQVTDLTRAVCSHDHELVPFPQYLANDFQERSSRAHDRAGVDSGVPQRSEEASEALLPFNQDHGSRFRVRHDVDDGQVCIITPGQLRCPAQSVIASHPLAVQEQYVLESFHLYLPEAFIVVFEYAEEIFSVGAELAEVVRTRSPRGPVVFTVGITDVVPKLVAARVLEPALALPDPVRIVCLEGKLEALLADLAIHRVDMVLSDRPAPEGLNIRAYTHRLGDSGVSFFADAGTARRLRRRLPRSLCEAPLLLPTLNTVLRRSINT